MRVAQLNLVVKELKRQLRRVFLEAGPAAAHDLHLLPRHRPQYPAIYWLEEPTLSVIALCDYEPDERISDVFLAAYEDGIGRSIGDMDLWDGWAVARPHDAVETWAPNYAPLGRGTWRFRLARGASDC
jgi:hypothetical protein